MVRTRRLTKFLATMHRFYPTIIRPLLSLFDPKIMVEIGSADGAHTQLLLEDCKKRNAVLHSIDPLPQWNTDDWVKKMPQIFVFHTTTSAVALPIIPSPDLVLIDGDHNWYTVHEELSFLCKDEALMPLILLHDVGWPYGRRDMYHDPSRIPQKFLQPNIQRGLLPGESRVLAGAGGINPHTFHAELEGGIQNGVLTAVEDVRKSVCPHARLILVPGFHGLGILAPKRLETSHPALWKFLDLLETNDTIHAHILAIERDRSTARSAYELQRDLHRKAREELEQLVLREGGQ